MRLLTLVMALMSAGSSTADLLRPRLCADCGCIEGVPFMVDCMETSYQEFPLTFTDEYPFTWALSLRANPLSHVPAILPQQELIKISFRDTLVSTIEDSAFASLPQLASLDLSHAKLTGDSFTRDAFKGTNELEDRHAPLPSLVELDISYNQIHTLREDAFFHFTHLRSLTFTDNPLKDFTRSTLSTFTHLRNLTKLDLSRCQLTRLPDQFLAELRNLEEFILAGNMFETVPEELSHSKSLRKINLDGNPILVVSASRSSSFRGPPTLEELSMCHMPYLRGVGKEGLTGLSSLHTLKMTDNPHMMYLDKLAFLTRIKDRADNLTTLHLQNNRLTTLDRTTLNWENLRELNIEHNPWRCDCELKWITERPLDLMMDSPRDSKAIVCASPPAKLGVNMVTLVSEGYTFPCEESKDLPPYPAGSGAFVVATIITGLVFIVASTVICVFVLYQKSKDELLSSRTVHYRRAADTDTEAIAHQMEA